MRPNSKKEWKLWKVLMGGINLKKKKHLIKTMVEQRWISVDKYIELKEAASWWAEVCDLVEEYSNRTPLTRMRFYARMELFASWKLAEKTLRNLAIK